MRIAGFDIPEEKKVEVALTYIYGVGRSNVYEVLSKAGVKKGKRVKDLTQEDRKKIQTALNDLKIGGDLRAKVTADIKRYKLIGSYRGLRHSRGLPVRGQRTRTNARTKRGKRVTIGAIKKKVAARMGLLDKKDSEDKKKKEK